MIGRRYAVAFVVAGSAALIACSSSSSTNPGAASNPALDGGDDVTVAPADAGGTDAGPSPTMTTVGATGGVVSGSGVTLTIPAGALAGDTSITITPGASPIPSGYVGLSSLYTFGPDGTTFLKPVAIDFTITSAGANPTVFWSNATGGYDPLATTVSGTTVSSSVMHFSSGFVADDSSVIGVAADAGDGDGDGDAGTVADAATDDAMSGDAAASDATAAGDADTADAATGASDAGIEGFTATIDGVPTVFATSPLVAYANGISTIKANDNASSTYWQLQLVVLFNEQQESCSTSGRYPSITYTHVTSGVIDQAFSTIESGGACLFTVASTAESAGQEARGTFTATVIAEPDAGTGSHSIQSGTYDVTM